jgi:hypothetical protein
LDPLTDGYPYYTPYQYAGNEPIANVDLDGLEPLGAIGAATNRAAGFGNMLSKGFTAWNIASIGIHLGQASSEVLTGGTEEGGKLYKSEEAAVIAWARIMAGNTAKNQNEYSSNIFSVKGKDGNIYYGYTPPVSFENVEGHIAYKECPGPDDFLSTQYLPAGSTLIANIHSHTGAAGWRDNNNFSPSTFANGFGGDEGVMRDHQNLKFYLVTPNGKLINDMQGPNYPMAIGLPESANPSKVNPDGISLQWAQLYYVRSYQDLEPVDTWQKKKWVTTPPFNHPPTKRKSGTPWLTPVKKLPHKKTSHKKSKF